MLQIIQNIGELNGFVGREVGVSEWIEISAERIRQFGFVTEDEQWIHVDEARAKLESPFQKTIAHGFLTVSLLSRMATTAMRIDGLKMAINYGFNRVRFIAPVPSNSRIRGRFVLNELTEINRTQQAVWQVTVEREHHEKPVCAAEWLVLYYS